MVQLPQAIFQHKLLPNQVHVHENFKQLGSQQVTIGLHKQVQAVITIEIVNADPDGITMEEALAAEQEAANT